MCPTGTCGLGSCINWVSDAQNVGGVNGFKYTLSTSETRFLMNIRCFLRLYDNHTVLPENNCINICLQISEGEIKIRLRKNKICLRAFLFRLRKKYFRLREIEKRLHASATFKNSSSNFPDFSSSFTTVFNIIKIIKFRFHFCTYIIFLLTL